MREARVRARQVRVVVARGARVAPRQRPARARALAHQYVVVASVSLYPNTHTLKLHVHTSPH